MPLREQQEIQEMLRRLSVWESSRVSHADGPHTATYLSVQANSI